jgi:hypothetical protein
MRRTTAITLPLGAAVPKSTLAEREFAAFMFVIASASFLCRLSCLIFCSGLLLNISARGLLHG